MFQRRRQLTSTFNQLLVCHAGEDYSKTTLPVVLNADLLNSGHHLHSKIDLEHLRQLAMNRAERSQLTKRVVEAALAKLT